MAIKKYLGLFFVIGLFSCIPKKETINITIYPLEGCFATRKNNIQFLKLSTDKGYVEIYPCGRNENDSLAIDSIARNERLLCYVYELKKDKNSDQNIQKIYTFWFESKYWEMDSVNVVADITRF